MNATQELLDKRKQRVRKAIALEKTDKTPLILMADAFCARHMGVTMAEFCSSFEVSNKVMLDSLKALGDLEGINAAFAPPSVLPLIFLTHVKVPGKELPVDSLWQLDEKEMMTTEDYDTILKDGWMPFMTDFMVNRLKFPLSETFAELGKAPKLIQNIEDAGYMVYSPLNATSVTELIAGGRSMSKFTRDMYRIPDKVEAVLDRVQAELLPMIRQQVRDSHSEIVFFSPARGASEFFSPKLWERFVWKYLKQTAEVIIEEGACVNIHIDANWERDLDFFKSLPKAKCIFESDGVTSIYKIKEKLGDHMCIKGDVGAALLSLGSAEDVYSYCAKIIKDIGPGLILSSGCSTPPDARVENVKAMIAAAAEN